MKQNKRMELGRTVGMGAGGWDWLAKKKGLTGAEKKGRNGEIVIWTAGSGGMIKIHWIQRQKLDLKTEN